MCKINVKIGNINIELGPNSDLGQLLNNLKTVNTFLIENDDLVERINDMNDLSVKPGVDLKEASMTTHEINEDITTDLENDNLRIISKGLGITEVKLLQIFDFGLNTELPPLIMDLGESARTKAQRKALLIYLYLKGEK